MIPEFPFSCSLGLVLDFGDGDIYRIQKPDGQVISIVPRGSPSSENVEEDISNVAPVLATPIQIKNEAQRRILEIAPAWKQSNMIARVLEIVRDHGSSVGTWPEELQVENATYQAIWERIKAIRAFSDQLEADLPLAGELVGQNWPT